MNLIAPKTADSGECGHFKTAIDPQIQREEPTKRITAALKYQLRATEVLCL